MKQASDWVPLEPKAFYAKHSQTSGKHITIDWVSESRNGRECMIWWRKNSAGPFPRVTMGVAEAKVARVRCAITNLKEIRVRVENWWKGVRLQKELVGLNDVNL